MNIVYTGEELPETIVKSIFLAGPSLRPDQEKEMESWRKDALKILEDKGFDGVVFVPENKGFDFPKDFDYDDQVNWEEKCLNVADCIVFWVPRDLSPDSKGNAKLAALTTNIEWGTWASSGKVVYGAPEDADKVRYLKHYADKYKVPVGDTLTETLEHAMTMVEKGAERSGGERYVPLQIWNTTSFQSWYSAQKKAGNRLNGARLLYSFRPGYRSFVFMWVLSVDIHIESEDRNKTNEFVLARTDISSVCLWHRNDKKVTEQEVVLVKEFRSPANTEDGFIRELPGGSSFKPNEDPQEVASEEVYEETGFHLKPGRLKVWGSRQLSGTLSSHKSYLYSAELTDEELEWFKAQAGIVHGNIADTEMTFIEVHRVEDILEKELTDWTTLGQILYVLIAEQ
jgi:8-oxo-dGTP pyrophosphatase MutT (NUDIX family)/nucleoside 2-deoxyribosyltransferase